jgi:hypothetical protein
VKEVGCVCLEISRKMCLADDYGGLYRYFEWMRGACEIFLGS